MDKATRMIDFPNRKIKCIGEEFCVAERGGSVCAGMPDLNGGPEKRDRISDLRAFDQSPRIRNRTPRQLLTWHANSAAISAERGDT
jgi:hypothetical protein